MLQFSSYTEGHRPSKYQNGRIIGNLMNVFESPSSQYAHAYLMSCPKFQVRSIDLNVLVIILLAPLTPLVTPPTLRSITGKPSRLVVYLPTIMFHFPPIPSSSSLLASLQSPITSSWQRHLVSAFGPFFFSFLFLPRLHLAH